MIVYLLQLVAWTTFMAAVILWPAGTLAFPGAWVLIGLFALGGLASIFWLSKHSPSLLRERMASPVQRAQKPWDRVWLVLFILAFFGWMAFMGWDAARIGFTAAPCFRRSVALASRPMDSASGGRFAKNPFAAPVVKIQESQRVIDTGPYAIVRHPMYASGLFLFIGIPLLLGSWLGLAFSALFILAIAWRAVQEERALRAELTGYEDYAARVRSRLVPFVW